MKKIIFILMNFIVATLSHGQNKLEKISNEILEEGKKLYRSEMASWYGTDLFLEKYSHRKRQIGGYFSYADNSTTRCLFYSNSEVPKVIGTITFDESFDLQHVMDDSTIREFSDTEFEFYKIRSIALAEINTDTLFKTYKNSSLNLIPIIESGVKKVYVLTGPQMNGMVYFGNDYLLTFNKKNNLISKKPLHRNIIPMKYDETTSDAVTVHTHREETGEFITATDVCTLLLYGKIANWKQHMVVSKTYVSMWDCNTERLMIMTRKAWDRIYKDQQKVHPR